MTEEAGPDGSFVFPDRPYCRLLIEVLDHPSREKLIIKLPEAKRMSSLLREAYGFEVTSIVSDPERLVEETAEPAVNIQLADRIQKHPISKKWNDLLCVLDSFTGNPTQGKHPDDRFLDQVCRTGGPGCDSNGGRFVIESRQNIGGGNL